MNLNAPRRIADRIGAASGVLAGGLLFAGTVLADPADADLNPNPTSSAADLARALAANREQARLGALLVLLGVWLLILFFGRLTAQLRSRSGRAGWLPFAVLGGGMLVCATYLLDGGFGLAASELGDFGPDVQVAKAFFLWGWTSGALHLAPIGATVLAAVAAVFLDGQLPEWFGWFSVLILALLLVLVIGNLVGLAGIVGLAWIVVASTAMLVARPLAEE